MNLFVKPLSRTIDFFVESAKNSCVLLAICMALALALANSSAGAAYLDFWQTSFGGMNLEHLVNDGLMAVFFLLIGLELERELYVGELSDFRKALLPIVAAIGGVCLPVLIHFALNAGTPTQAGMGIPMATDIAFVLGALSLLGSRVPGSLKVFLTALAVMDDLMAIIVIALFYSGGLDTGYLIGALAVFGVLAACNRLRIMALTPYLLGGVLMWFLMLKSGVHATIAGVLLAFAIPFTSNDPAIAPPSLHLEHLLHKPVAYLILPLFALANSGIIIGPDGAAALQTLNSMGIVGGLVVGKPLGITLFSIAAVTAGLCALPEGLRWPHILGAGFLAGIGFTMSIFVANLAFPGSPELGNASKMAILLASLVAGALGLLWLKLVAPPTSEAGTVQDGTISRRHGFRYRF